MLEPPELVPALRTSHSVLVNVDEPASRHLHFPTNNWPYQDDFVSDLQPKQQLAAVVHIQQPNWRRRCCIDRCCPRVRSITPPKFPNISFLFYLVL